MFVFHLGKKNKIKIKKKNLLTVFLYVILYLCVYAQSLSHVWLFAAPWTIPHQAPLPMEFSRQEYLLGPHFLPQVISVTPRIEPRISCISCVDRQILYL